MTEISEKNFYQILEVGIDASPEQLEKAYFNLARKYHPDIAGETREASLRFMEINEAFQTLSDPALRRKYDESMHVPMASRAPIVVGTDGVAIRAKTSAGMQQINKELRRAIRIAEKVMKSGDFWRATEVLQKMLPEYPRQPDLRRALARAAENRHRYREAAEHLKIACEVEYFNADNHVLLGRIYMKGDQWARATESFRTALSWSEGHHDALQGIEDVETILEKKKPFLKRIPGILNLRKRK